MAMLYIPSKYTAINPKHVVRVYLDKRQFRASDGTIYDAGFLLKIKLIDGTVLSFFEDDAQKAENRLTNLAKVLNHVGKVYERYEP